MLKNFNAIEEHLRVHRLRCLGHLERMNTESIVKRIWKKEIVGRKRKGRPHKTWNDIIKRRDVEVESFFKRCW